MYIEPMEGVAFQDVNHACRMQDSIMVRHINNLLIMDHVLASFLKHPWLDFVPLSWQLLFKLLLPIMYY